MASGVFFVDVWHWPGGLPKDAAKAEYWRAKTEQDKLAQIQADQKAQDQVREYNPPIQTQQAQMQQAQQQRNAQGMLVLGLLLGAFASDFDEDASRSDPGLERERLSLSACGNPYMQPAACGH